MSADAARESCKAKVTEADGVLTSAKQKVEEKKREGDAPIEKARKAKEELDKAIDVDLVAVLTGEDKAASKKHCEALLPIAASLGLDESLLSALPAACAKRAIERGHFDKVVVDALEASLKAGR